VVGAGLAGATAAAVLGKQSWRVTLVDPRPSCPPVFKAEKIEPDQARLLRKFGLLEIALPNARRIRQVQGYYNGRLFSTSQTEQYGTYYSDMVNSLRAHLPCSVEFKRERVVDIASGEDLQRVKLGGGEQLTCRLVVLACGLSAELPASIGLRRTYIQKHQSAAFAFTIARPDRSAFPFDSLSYYSVDPGLGLDYLTLFPIGDCFRANLFAFPRAGAPWMRELIVDPNRVLPQCLPKLSRAIGDYRVISKVESAVVHLYRTEGEPAQGIVLIGDATQNVCPSTGMGLSKIFTDVDVLSSLIPSWFKTVGMDKKKLVEFCNHPEKCAVDKKALENASYRRKAATERGLKWTIHRTRVHFEMQFRRPTEIEYSRA
jgi:2-polyprenyl-6-methoxyphenol hydroxylase-like FAD-dependent oxidoreductase